MSAYVKSPFKPNVKLLVAGRPSYVFGSYNDKTGPTVAQVITLKSNGTTTATIVFQILSGNIPVNGALITVISSTLGGGNFNVTNVAIANVTQVNTPDNGMYSATYAISSTATPTSATADVGQVMIPQPEIGENLTTDGASEPVAAPYNNPALDQGKAISATVSFPAISGVTTACVVKVQGADLDIDSEYQDIATVGSLVSGALVGGHWMSGQGAAAAEPVGAEVPNLTNYRFYRFNVSSTANLGSPGATTVVGKIET